MKKSRCFLESGGRLDCTSCHDPHELPAREERTEFYRQQCLACHETNGCYLAEPVRLARPLSGPASTMYSIVFSPDSATLAAASTGGTVWLWHVADPARATRDGAPLVTPSVVTG